MYETPNTIDLISCRLFLHSHPPMRRRSETENEKQGRRRNNDKRKIDRDNNKKSLPSFAFTHRWMWVSLPISLSLTSSTHTLIIFLSTILWHFIDPHVMGADNSVDELLEPIKIKTRNECKCLCLSFLFVPAVAAASVCRFVLTMSCERAKEIYYIRRNDMRWH